MLCLGIIAVITIVAFLFLCSFTLINKCVEEQVDAIEIPETIELVDSFNMVTYLGDGDVLGVHNTIYVVHDSNRNVTCYLYKDGISCILDRRLKGENK